MNAEIIAVGSELLLGQIVNTNARFLSRQLAELGVNVYFQTVVGDNAERLEAVIEEAEKRADLLIFTGGLGPTKDDLTKETVAKRLGKRLVMNEPSLKAIEAYFSRTGRPVTDNNKKQALVIEDSHVLMNEKGMAPGMMLGTSTHMYMLLPGPPQEMEPMFLTHGYGLIYDKLSSKERIHSKVLRFFGIGEAHLETEIMDLLDKQTNPTLALLASEGEVSIRITAKSTSIEEADVLILRAEEEIRNRVGQYCYGADDTSLMKETVKEIASLRLTIAAAESLTGGMFQQELTGIAGAGNIFKGGIVSYTNEAKSNVLKVSDETIATEGVVSEYCAKEMAEQAMKLFQADIGISFTGVAGPDPLEGHPVGTVFIGLAWKGKETKAIQLNLAGDRTRNRIMSVKHGCSLLLKEFKKNR